MKPGDEIWVKALVTSVKDDRVGIGVRIAARVGTSYPGSSPKNARVINGVVYRTVEVPKQDIKDYPYIDLDPDLPGAGMV